MSECDHWPLEVGAEDDPMVQQAIRLLNRDASEGLGDEESTARHPLVQKLDARLNRLGTRFWDEAANRLLGMSNIEQMRMLTVIQKTIWYYYPYSAPIWIEDGIGYLTGCVQMQPLLGLKPHESFGKELWHGDLRGFFRFRHAIETFQGATASEPRWRPESKLITADPCGIVTLKDEVPWEVRSEFELGYTYEPSDMSWDVLEGEHKAIGEWRAVGNCLSEITSILTRMASGRLFAKSMQRPH